MANVTVADLSTWLSSQDANTPDTAYEINLTDVTSSNISSIKTSLQANPTKYVDLSPTYITNYPTDLSNMFESCETLVAQPSFQPISGSNITMYQMFKGCTNLREGKVYENTQNANEAFSGCRSLTSVTFTSTLKYMSDMFYGCTSLQTIPTIPDSVQNMLGAFAQCRSLIGISNFPSSLTSLYLIGAFYGCYSLTDVPSSIPSGITSLSQTFTYCLSLVNAPSIPDTVTNLYETFAGCRSLSAPPIIPYGVTNMTRTFQGCVSMASAPTIPDSVTIIPNCFENCPFYTVDAVPSSITSAVEAFKGCSNLESIKYFGITLSTLRDNTSFQNMFSGCDSLESIGFTSGRADDWHFYYLNISANDFEHTVIDKDKTRHTDTESFTRTTLVLPELTDELWFTPSNLSAQDILDIIDKVIDYKLSYFNKDMVDPTKRSFILLSDNPDDTITNLKLGGGEDSPLGSIQAYYGTTDPADKRWLICDGRDTTGTDIELETHYPSLYTFLGGTNVLPDLREVTLVGAGQNGTDTIATHDVYTLGQFKDDQLQGHEHSIGYKNEKASGTAYNYTRLGSNISDSNKTKGIVEDTQYGTPRVGETTHGKQKGINYIIKAVASTDTYEPPSTEIQQIEQYVDAGLDVVKGKVAQTESYSATEQLTGGTWIDGKPIYRKVVDCGALPNNANKYVPHNISNIETVVKLYAIASKGDDWMPLPEYYSGSGGMGLSLTTTSVFIQTYSNRSSYTSTYAIIEYTKSTD